MTLQTSGAISLGDIATEFGDTAPNSMSEFYRNGSLVPDQKIVSASGTALSTLSGSNAPLWQGGTRPNNLQVYQGYSASPSGLSYLSGADRYLSNGSLISESQPQTMYPTFSTQNNGTWTAPYAGTVNIICVGAGAASSYWGREGGDNGAGGGAVYATATVSNGAVLTWHAGGMAYSGGLGSPDGAGNRGGSGGGGTTRVTGTNSSGTAFTVRALGGQYSPFSWFFGQGTSGLSINSRARTRGGPAYATGGCTQVAAADGGHGFWFGSSGTSVPSGWGDSGFNSIVTSTTTWSGHTSSLGRSHSTFTSLSFNSSTGVLTTGSGGWGQGGSKQDYGDGTGSVGAPGVVFIWMDPEQYQSINQTVPTSGTISFNNFYGGENA